MKAAALKILLDSHAFAWFILSDRRCSGSARSSIEARDADVYVSGATAFELSTKSRFGKWPEVENLAAQIENVIYECKFLSLPISIRHAQVAGALPSPHKDPFDRILAAQAQVEDLILVTADPAFKSFGTRTLW